MFSFSVPTVPDLHSAFGLARNPNFILCFLFASAPLCTRTSCCPAGTLGCMYTLSDTGPFPMAFYCVLPHLFYCGHIEMVACFLPLILLFTFDIMHVIPLSVFLVHRSIFSFSFCAFHFLCLPFFLLFSLVWFFFYLPASTCGALDYIKCAASLRYSSIALRP